MMIIMTKKKSNYQIVKIIMNKMMILLKNIKLILSNHNKIIYNKIVRIKSKKSKKSHIYLINLR